MTSFLDVLDEKSAPTKMVLTSLRQNKSLKNSGMNTWPASCSLQEIWLVVSTPLKNISQNGNLPQIGVKMTNI